MKSHFSSGKFGQLMSELPNRGTGALSRLDNKITFIFEFQ